MRERSAPLHHLCVLHEPAGHALTCGPAPPSTRNPKSFSAAAETERRFWRLAGGAENPLSTTKEIKHEGRSILCVSTYADRSVRQTSRPSDTSDEPSGTPNDPVTTSSVVSIQFVSDIADAGGGAAACRVEMERLRAGELIGEADKVREWAKRVQGVSG
ncbi:putative phenol 2-monooxygenase, oxygenase component [Streptomyces sp. CBMAI 2042]|nr:putative phenol 2-monooxygenase, oxygenase component [Streptomyces sp. CBMAI 2042]